MSVSVVLKETEVKNGQSPQYNADMDGETSTHYWLVDWNDYSQAEYEIMGYSERASAGQLSRALPMADPLKPYLYAERVTFVEGKGAYGYDTISLGSGYTQKIGKYHKAVMRVDYKWRPYWLYENDEIDDEYERYVEIEENGATDYITPPGLAGQMKWVGGGTTVNQQTAFGATYGKLIPYSNVTMTWHQVPYAYYPRQTIIDSYGKVSSADLGTVGEVDYFKSATLLFCGARWRRYASNYAGTPMIDLIYYFRHDTGQNPDQAAQRGPNTFPCFQETPWVRRLISITGLDPGIGSRSGKCIYDEFDPNDLFTVT